MDSTYFSPDEHRFIAKEKERITDFCKRLACDVQSRLLDFNPLPYDHEYTKFFNTIQVETIRNYEKIWELYGGNEDLQHWRFADDPKNPNISLDEDLLDVIDPRLLYFSIGFSKNDIFKAIDGLNIFDAQTITNEIADFAECYLHVRLDSNFTTYTYNNASPLKVEALNGEMKQNALNSIDIFSMIPHFKSMVYAIEMAVESKRIDFLYEWRTIPSLDWSDDFWTEKQKVLHQTFVGGDDILKAFDFSKVKPALKKPGLQPINDFSHMLDTYMHSRVEDYLEDQNKLNSYDDYEEQMKKNKEFGLELESLLNPLKRKIETQINNLITKKRKVG